MKTILTFATAAGMGAAGLAQPAPPATSDLLRLRTAFDSLSTRLTLTPRHFLAQGERAWVGKH